MPSLDGEIRDGRHHMRVWVYYEDADFSPNGLLRWHGIDWTKLFPWVDA